MNKTKSALLIIDMQNDFFPGGSLAILTAPEILPTLNHLLSQQFDTIIATKDWHPINHISFADTHKKNVGESISIDGIDQALWPSHCVQNTLGSEFSDGWDTTKIKKVIQKGASENIDSYSAFFDNHRKQSTELDKYLKENEIKQLFVVGLATNFCVKYTVLDALKLGFKTYVVLDGCRGIDISPGDTQKALSEMEAAGAIMITSSEYNTIMQN